MSRINFKKSAKIGDTTYYPIREISRMFGITTLTLAKYCRSGKLKGKKIGGTWVITESNLKQFLGNDEEEIKSLKGSI